ncbi:hypothetical protein Dimus_007722 [Dionaea muscipula]
MESHSNLPMFLMFASLVLCLSSITIEASAQVGFTVDLIHRDSPRSPWFNSSATKWTLVNNAIHRSISRAKQLRLRISNGPIETPVLPANGEFLMKLTIGTPPSPFLGIVDTGSDLIWTQCKPCINCFRQSIPVFDPKSSSTFKPVGCHAKRCLDLGNNMAGCSSRNTCMYRYAYGDQSTTNGELVTETLGFGPRQSMENVFLGCGHKNQGTFNAEGSGLIGLGGGPMSLISQMGDGKLAYCLVPFQETTSTGKIMFGADAVVSGRGVVSTPLLRGSPSTFYYLTLEGMSVGDRRVPFKVPSSVPPSFNGDNTGNIIIDSGTTLTLLPDDFFSDLTSEVMKAISADQVDDPQGILQLCYGSGDVDQLNVPIITAHFDGGDVELKPANTFIAVDERTVCLAMLPSSDTGMAIFGNLAQMNFLVFYDITAGEVSFKGIDCSKLQEISSHDIARSWRWILVIWGDEMLCILALGSPDIGDFLR